MIVPNFRPPILTPIKIQGSSTNIPDAVNWSDILFDKSEERHKVSEQRITGIAQPITLSIEWFRAANLYLFYRISQTPLPEGITMYNILSTDPNAPDGLTFDPYNNDGFQDNYRAECEFTHGFTSAGAYPSDTCDEIVVNNNDYVAFACYQTASPPFVPYSTFTVTIKNQSNGGALLDTFDCINQA